jgi:hypothetical protein
VAERRVAPIGCATHPRYSGQKVPGSQCRTCYAIWGRVSVLQDLLEAISVDLSMNDLAADDKPGLRTVRSWITGDGFLSIDRVGNEHQRQRDRGE